MPCHATGGYADYLARRVPRASSLQTCVDPFFIQRQALLHLSGLRLWPVLQGADFPCRRFTWQDYGRI